MFDSAFRIRIIFGPETDKLLQMVWPKDGPIPGQIVEIVHNDGHKQIYNEEWAKHEEGNEIRIGKIDT